MWLRRCRICRSLGILKPDVSINVQLRVDGRGFDLLPMRRLEPKVLRPYNLVRDPNLPHVVRFRAGGVAVDDVLDWYCEDFSSRIAG